MCDNKAGMAEFEKAAIRVWFFDAGVASVCHTRKLRKGQATGTFSLGQLGPLNKPQVQYKTLERFHSQVRGNNEN